MLFTIVKGRHLLKEHRVLLPRKAPNVACFRRIEFLICASKPAVPSSIPPESPPMSSKRKSTASSRRTKVRDPPTDEDSRPASVDESSNDIPLPHSSDVSMDVDDVPTIEVPPEDVAAEPHEEYELNKLVLSMHTDSFFYPAKIIHIARDPVGLPIYTIHYSGWNSRYDEIVGHEEALKKFVAHTPENVRTAKEEIQNAKKRKKSKKAKTGSESGSRKANRSATPGRSDNLHSSLSGKTDSERYSVTNDDLFADNPVTDAESIASLEIPSSLPKERQINLVVSPGIDALLADDCEFVKASKLINLPAKFTIDKIFEEYVNSLQGTIIYIYVGHPDQLALIENNLQALKRSFDKTLHRTVLYKAEIPQYLEHLNAQRKSNQLTEMSLKDFVNSMKPQQRSESPISDDDSELPDGQIVSYLMPKKESDEAPEVSEKRAARPSTSAKRKSGRVSQRRDTSDEPLELTFTNVYGFMHFLRYFFGLSRFIKNDVLSWGTFNEFSELLNDLVRFMETNKARYYRGEADYTNANASYLKQVTTLNNLLTR
uniref:MRG domain-containing protein n=1 Tax=Panagrellus redivivus TaxID=6233 RepID=A0A7E4VIL5_PANRE